MAKFEAVIRVSDTYGTDDPEKIREILRANIVYPAGINLKLEEIISLEIKNEQEDKK